MTKIAGAAVTLNKKTQKMQIKIEMKFSRNHLLIEIYCDLILIADGKKQYTLKHKTHEHTLLNWPIGDEFCKTKMNESKCINYIKNQLNCFSFKHSIQR